MNNDLELALNNWVKANIIASYNTDIMIKYGYDILYICSDAMSYLGDCKDKLDLFKDYKAAPKELKRFWKAEDNYNNNKCSCAASSIRGNHPECNKLSKEYFQSKTDLISFVRENDLNKEITKNMKSHPENFALSYRITHKLKNLIKT